MLNNSTILRGDTSDSRGVGQATLEGSPDCVNPQVYILKYNGVERIGEYQNGMPKFKDLTFEEFDRGIFNETVLHELLHSFTGYIVTTFRMNKEREILSEEEILFYNIIIELHKDFLKEHKTNDAYLDSLDEFIARTISGGYNWNGSKYKESMTEAFEEMYRNNNRKIISLSKHLRNNVI